MPSSTPHHSLPSRARRRARRLLVASGLVLLLASAAATGYGYTMHRYDQNVAREKGVIDENRKDRPRKPLDMEAQNWLVVGSDTRAKNGTSGDDAKEPLWKRGAQRTDTMMIVHLAEDDEQISVTSLPRDTWVDIPGHGRGRLNAAFSYGGPQLLVRTVEKLTDVPIDHYAAIDFAGFTTMTNAVGGVDVTVPRTVTDCSNGTVWRKGEHHLDGRRALLYVRQRCGLPNGDLDRIRRQQAFLMALLDRARSGDVLANPRRLDQLLDATSKSITVDDSVSGGMLRSLAFHYRDTRQDDLTFLTLPIRGDGTVAGQAVLFMDDAEAAKLFEALRDDTVDQYVRDGGERNNREPPA